MKLTDTYKHPSHASVIKTVQLDQLVIGKRLRPVDPESVKSLAESIAQVGLLQPIVVAKTDDANEFLLIAGRHRVAALKKNGVTEVRAVVRTVANRDEAQILEIDENIARNELSAAEEASQLKLRKELWEKVAATSGKKLTGKGKSEAGMSTREIAKKTGKSKDVIARGLKRAKVLKDDLDDVKGTKLDKGTELDALVKLKKTDKAKAKQVIEDAKAGKKVSAKAALKETEKEQAKAKGAKAVQKLSDKDLKTAVRDISVAMGRHKHLQGDKRWDDLCSRFVEWCDDHEIG